MAEKRAQRRLAAILAADVVGYSRLMERDESGTLAVLKTRRSEVLQPVGFQASWARCQLMATESSSNLPAPWTPLSAGSRCRRPWTLPMRVAGGPPHSAAHRDQPW